VNDKNTFFRQFMRVATAIPTALESFLKFILWEIIQITN